MIRFLALLLLTALCSSSVWAAREPLAEPKLSRELQQLEEGSHPERIYRLRVAALAANYDVYPPEIQGRIVRLQCWAMPAERDGEYRRVVEFADKALQRARERKDGLTEAGLLTCRAFHQQLLGNMKQAKADYEQALQLARNLGDRLQEADILSQRGDMYAYQGKLAEGLQELMEAHRGYEALGLDGKARETLGHIANAYRRMGLYERAEGYFKELEKEYEKEGEEERQISIISQQGVLYSEMGEYARARPLLEQAEQFYRKQQQDGFLAWSQIELATILHYQGKGDQAMAKLQQAEAILLRSSDIDSVTQGHWQLVMGMVLETQGKLPEALASLARAEPIFVKENNQRFLTRLYEVRSRIFESKGQIKEALANLKLYVKTRTAVEKVLMEQRTLQMRFEFDMARKELAHQTLKTKQLLQEAELQQLRERRYWQYLVVLLLLVLMGIAVFYQHRRSRKMHRLAMTDELTGIHNRRQIQKLGEESFQQSRSSGKSFSVLLLDIDHFKQVNDQLGHHVGDSVLVAVASSAEGQLRSLDRIGRNGGEEFLVLLPDTGLDEAVEVAERIRYHVSLLKVDGVPEGHAIHVSIGCAELSSLDETLSDLIKRADGAMYRAKQAGRNLVMRAE
ncbi:tetratricopeptide repeat-containing diguanylate cyclase [Aeromonas jandaei]|uniref:tetratricopeptide repeat-containing diguanylate cyclase n=1 Tax=Aeromonas jandaei TaxID=650 RepID=UPI002B059846|nr:tetratricopeptide repeat-containing diguanylate cyclase [Aeromonas jandaei]